MGQHPIINTIESQSRVGDPSNLRPVTTQESGYVNDVCSWVENQDLAINGANAMNSKRSANNSPLRDESSRINNQSRGDARDNKSGSRN